MHLLDHANHCRFWMFSLVNWPTRFFAAYCVFRSVRCFCICLDCMSNMPYDSLLCIRLLGLEVAKPALCLTTRLILLSIFLLSFSVSAMSFSRYSILGEITWLTMYTICLSVIFLHVNLLVKAAVI